MWHPMCPENSHASGNTNDKEDFDNEGDFPLNRIFVSEAFV